MNKIAASELHLNFNKVHQDIIDRLDVLWKEEKNREEKAFLAEVLQALTSELNTFEKFIM